VLLLMVILFFFSDLFGQVFLHKTNPAVVIIPTRIFVDVQQKKIAPNPRSPVRILIPKIHVDAFIELVGVTSSKIMDIPSIPSDAGWYRFGTYPGEKGSAVIDGHSGFFDGKPAVFDSLYRLQIGDEISIENAQGQISTFRVRELRSYDEKADTIDVFYSTDGISHLNLITCEPAWNEIQKNYFKRLVVFTDKINI